MELVTAILQCLCIFLSGANAWGNFITDNKISGILWTLLAILWSTSICVAIVK